MALQFSDLQREKDERPALVVTGGNRQFWWWKERFFWDSEGYESGDVIAIVLKNERVKRQQLEHAHDLLAGESTGHRKNREPIPEEVRRAVWRSYGGQCVNCGTTELLQFDQIIPVALAAAVQKRTCSFFVLRAIERRVPRSRIRRNGSPRSPGIAAPIPRPPRRWNISELSLYPPDRCRLILPCYRLTDVACLSTPTRRVPSMFPKNVLDWEMSISRRRVRRQRTRATWL
jgi:5-methylcytosine-specific restriction endonuclease McrA